MTERTTDEAVQATDATDVAEEPMTAAAEELETAGVEDVIESEALRGFAMLKTSDFVLQR